MALGDAMFVIKLYLLFRDWGLLRSLEGNVGEASLNDVAQHSRHLVRGPVQPGFMGEFQPDASIANPPYGTFDCAVLSKMKVDAVPQKRLEIGGDHGAPTRKVEQFHIRSATAPVNPCSLVDQPVTILGAAITQPTGLPRDRYAVQRVSFSAFWLLCPEDRFLGRESAAVHLGPDVHELLRDPRAEPCPSFGYGIVHFVRSERCRWKDWEGGRVPSTGVPKVDILTQNYPE